MARDSPGFLQVLNLTESPLLSLPSHIETLEFDGEFEKTFTRYYSELILRRLHLTLPILTVASLKFEVAHITLNNSIGYSISIPYYITP
jgi:hypothetical protein